MPRGVRVMTNSERTFRQAARDFLRRGGRTYDLAEEVKNAIDDVVEEARQDALTRYSPREKRDEQTSSTSGSHRYDEN